MPAILWLPGIDVPSSPAVPCEPAGLVTAAGPVTEAARVVAVDLRVARAAAHPVC